MDEQEFKTRADAALQSLYKKLAAASDRYEFEPDFNAGALAIEFDEPKAKFVVSPNAPVRQVWVSAHSRSFKLDWDSARQAFVLPESKESLLPSDCIGYQQTDGRSGDALTIVPGVYISYPFCNQKCTFCNFASGIASRPSRSLYEEALLREIRNHRWEWLPETIYFGGGTPSLLSPAILEDLLAAVPAGKLVEVTLECAPGTLSADRVSEWVKSGVNRVSLGVQSFDETELRHSGRRHTAETVKSDVDLLRAHGISNINLDLIAGLPHQTSESWGQSLHWIERLSPSHVSVYLFEVDEDSRLGKEILTGGTRYSASFLPPDEAAADFYEGAVEFLGNVGYRRYEISNFAQPGWESLHNLKYWKLEPYVGFGLDAHSYDGTFRWGNPDELAAYLKPSESPRSRCEREKVDKLEERFFVGLRLTEGIRPTDAEWLRFASPIRKWSGLGMLEQRNGILRLSPRGVLMSNEVFQEFLNV